LTVYALILAFFFIPAGALDKDPHARTLHIATSSTYTISEEEIKPIYKLRKKIMKENKAVSHLTNLNPNIFCVNLSLELMELSYQTYYDPDNSTTTISSFGSLNLKRLDYVLPQGYSFHDVEHETVCYVFKHKTQPKVVVSFRGTSSQQHWNDNLNYRQLYVDIHELTMTELDLIDGLDPSLLVDEENEDEEAMGNVLRESIAERERKSEMTNHSVIFRSKALACPLLSLSLCLTSLSVSAVADQISLKEDSMSRRFKMRRVTVTKTRREMDAIGLKRM
jgi:hypothetical protein